MVATRLQMAAARSAAAESEKPEPRGLIAEGRAGGYEQAVACKATEQMQSLVLRHHSG